MKENSKTYLTLTLSILTAFGPLVTDMYLPALPSLTKYFSTSVSAVQLSLSAGMLGIALGQLLLGALSDKTGRKTPLVGSLLLFLLSTVGSLFVTGIVPFIILRFIQGIGAAGGIVIARSISSDLFQGRDLLKFLALIAAVQGIAPVLAPVIGGSMLTFTDWRGIFVLLAAVGIILLALSLGLNESLPAESRVQTSLAQSFKVFGPVLRNGEFMLHTCILSFAMAVMFGYIGCSPFIFQEHYGLSPFAYGLVFGLNAVALTAGALLAGRIENQCRALRVATIVLFIGIAFVSVALFTDAPFLPVTIGLFVSMLAAGLIFPVSTNLALAAEQTYRGTASAIVGASSFLFGCIVTPLVGLGDIMVTSGIVMTVCAAACLSLTLRSGIREPDLS